jgi:hypothetical protein
LGGDCIQLPRGPLRGIPPLLIPDIFQDLIFCAAGVDEADLTTSEGIIQVKPPGHNTAGEMGPYVILVEDRECLITDIDPIPFTRVKRLPGFIHRSGAKSCLQSLQAPPIIFPLKRDVVEIFHFIQQPPYF